MAKLEGVNVINMRDGEITKIEYEGEEYTKDENVTEPIDGDIALNKLGTRSYTKGAFYELREGLTNYGSFGTKTDDQDSKNNGKSRDHFDVFRKVSAPTITERVDGLETRVSALEADQTDESPKEFDKPAQVGDTILITDAYLTGGYYKNGDNLTVKEVDEEGDVVTTEEYGHFFIANGEFKIIGRKEATEKESKESLVGKYVVFSDTDGADLTKGKAYEIISEDDGYFLVHDDKGYGQWVDKAVERSRFTFEIFDEKPAENPSFEVGDCAKVVGRTNFSDIGEGTIVKITRTLDVDGEHRVDLLDESDHDYAKPDALEKVSESDAVFLANGRKPGEYKDGDIVEIIANTNYSANEVGDIGVVEYISAERKPLVNVSGRRQGRGYNHTELSDMKPVAFVEQRVDTDV